MGARIRGLTVLVVVLLVGAYLGSTFGQWSTASEPALPPVTAMPGERVRVEVLNGGGILGRALEARNRLRNRGFDVVYYGNQRPFERDSSVVIDRIGRPDLAEAVASVLGIQTVRTELEANLLLDVSVVLGREWVPQAGAEPASPAPAWWDLRRLFRNNTRSGEPNSRVDRLADPGDGGE